MRGAVACGRNPTALHRALRWGRASLRHPYRSPPPLPASSRVDSCLVVELPGIAPGLPRCERGVILVDHSPRPEPLTGLEPILVLYESTVPPSTLERHVVALAGVEPAPAAYETAALPLCYSAIETWPARPGGIAARIKQGYARAAPDAWVFHPARPRRARPSSVASRFDSASSCPSQRWGRPPGTRWSVIPAGELSLHAVQRGAFHRRHSGDAPAFAAFPRTRSA